ncbi:hypothetical protein ACFTXM_02970 [Streptomyces sp. NPDC056930]|uniref:hypothetical protein n=1 Tax=Streptomyces sp. NPDC056930 TaxID=3345967 RepID=UPI003645B610
MVADAVGEDLLRRVLLQLPPATTCSSAAPCPEVTAHPIRVLADAVSRAVALWTVLQAIGG